VRDRDPEALARLREDLLAAPMRAGVTTSREVRGCDVVTPVRFAEMAPPRPREYVVAGLVPRGHVATLFGDGGAAKSVTALSLATALAGKAESWLGRQVHNCPVLYADFELDADEQCRRAYQVARGVYLEKPPHDLQYVSGLGRPADELFTACLEVCAREEVGMMVVDSVGIALQGDAEHARDVIRFHREYLDPFREIGVTILVIDHQGKSQAGERYQNKRTFGSVYKENLARSVIQVEPADRGEGMLTLKVRQTKHNFGPRSEPFGVRLAFSEEKISLEESPLDATELAEETTLTAADRIMLTLEEGPSYPADIAEACNIPLGTVKNELTRLRRRGLVEYTDNTDPRTRAQEVRLTKHGDGFGDLQDATTERGPVAPDEGIPVPSAPREDQLLEETGIIQSERQVFELARQYFGGRGEGDKT
jgi:hypothetical protein